MRSILARSAPVLLLALLGSISPLAAQNFDQFVAIPLLLVHALLQTKTNQLVDSLEMASVKFLNAVTERQLKNVGA